MSALTQFSSEDFRADSPACRALTLRSYRDIVWWISGRQTHVRVIEMDPKKLKSHLLRAVFGAALGCVPFIVTLLMPVNHRSPYVIAYPAVILSAWLWETSGSVATALVAGLLIEHFIFATHQVSLAPTANAWGFRQLAFLLGSVLAGTLTRRAAQQRDRHARLAAERELSLARAEREIAAEKENSRDLARENEVRTELALEGADLGIWEWDLQTNQSRWSTGFYRLHRIEPSSEASYSLWHTMVHPDDRKTVEAEIERAGQTGDSFNCEYRVWSGESSQDRWIALGGKVVTKDDAGRPLVMAGYGLDITRRKNNEAALIQTEKLAIVGRLSASIAHEINNPLAAALNLIFLSRNLTVDSQSAKFLDEAAIQLDRVAVITRQMLSFSRKPTGPSSCQPAEVLDSVLRLLHPKIHLMEIRVVQEIRTKQAIPWIAGEFQQVLTNMVNNALESMTAGGGLRLRISDSRSWKNPTTSGVRVSIGDTGSGIAPDVLRRIREPFFTTKADTGTGLGMWVTYELIERHRGVLSVRTSTSAVRHGTVFSLFLPISPDATTRPDETAAR